MESSAAAAVPEPVDIDVWGTDGALARIERAVERFEAHRNEVSRAAAGNVGSQQGAQLGAHAAHVTVAIRSIEDGLHRLRAVRDGSAGAAPAEGRVLRSGVVTVEGGTAATAGGLSVPPSPFLAGDDEAFPVPVSADGDPFARQFLTVRPTSMIADLCRAAIERLGIEPVSGTWALHLEGRPLTDAMTAADAGLRRGSELVLLRVGE